jgi:ABC-type transporter Mla subunit MlaD
MADKGGVRSPRTRIKTLTQAALNADVTVEQLDTLLTGLGESLDGLKQTLGVFDGSLDDLDATLGRFNETINNIDALAPKLMSMVDRLEKIVERVERIVGIGESAVAPLAATENAVRGVVKAIRDRTHL